MVLYYSIVIRGHAHADFSQTQARHGGQARRLLRATRRVEDRCDREGPATAVRIRPQRRPSPGIRRFPADRARAPAGALTRGWEIERRNETGDPCEIFLLTPARSLGC